MLRFLTAGESHGESLVAILEGLPAGLKLSKALIDLELARRQKGFGSGARMKIEKDSVRILSGVLEGMTIGAPVAFLIKNKDHKKWYGKKIPAFTVPRPGHADLTAALKYGYKDLRPALERASARETAARVAVGAICKQLLAEFGIRVQGYVISIGEIQANYEYLTFEDRFQYAEQTEVRCPDKNASEKMQNRIAEVMMDGETLGGVIEVIALGLPAGLGSHVHWDRKLESQLGAAILSIPAIKGVEFGPAFQNTKRVGTQVHDPIRMDDEKIIRTSNNAGGIEGGISNGQPIIIRAAMKPIATTLKPQQSVNLVTGEEAQTNYERSDFCPVPRAVPVVEAMAAFELTNALLEKLGGDSMNELMTRYDNLPSMQLQDFSLDNENHLFWQMEE